MLQNMILVSLGAVLGALLRFFSYRSLGAMWVIDFPWVTLLVNVVGSFLFGFFLQQIQSSPAMGLFFGVGFLGSLTTFSTFSFESVQLLRDGRLVLFLANVGLSLLVGFGAFAFGLMVSSK